MVAVGHVDALPTPLGACIAVIEDLETMQIMQVPLEAHVLAIHLEGVQSLVAARIAGGFKEPQRSVVEVAHEGASVVDAHLLDLAGQGMLALLDEGLGHGTDILDATVEPHGRIDAVRQQIAGDAGTRGLHVQAPKSRPALRQFRIDRPILEEVGAVVEYLAELAGIDQLLGQHHGRASAVVVPNHVRNLGLLDGLHHGFSLLGIEGQRLLAQDHFSSLRRCDGNLGVKVVRDGDIHHVDVVPSDELLPIRFDGLIAPTICELLSLRGIARADRLEDDLIARREEVPDLGECVGVGAPHEAVADETDAKLFFGHRYPWLGDARTIGCREGGRQSRVATRPSVSRYNGNEPDGSVTHLCA